MALASPGTGKTTTISRIIQALTAKQGPEQRCNFLVLTFTRKTRFDLIAKLRQFSCSYETKKYLRTRVKNFHSFAYDVIGFEQLIDESRNAQRISKFLRGLKLSDKDEDQLRKEIKKVKEDLLARGADEQ